MPDVQVLDREVAERLRGAAYTYADPGLTRDDAAALPGFLPLRRSRVVGRGRECFERAADLVMTWQVLCRSGILPATSADRVAAGEVVQQRIPPLRPIVAPCRVVYVIDECDRQGFAYGTLPGHPERGEERFLLTYEPASEVVRFEVFSVSRPADMWLPTFPILRPMQHLFVSRFLRALG